MARPRGDEHDQPVEAEERGEDDLADYLVYRPEPASRPWRLYRTQGGFRVTGSPSEEELERALKAAGARKGATVEVGGEELELA